MRTDAIETVRFRGDVELLDSVRADEALMRRLESSTARRRRNALRCRLLSHAVRVNLQLTPHLAESFHRLRSQFGFDNDLEAYVHNEASVNAFIAKGTRRTLVVLSSGAVNLLSAQELEFVIGHELGHAIYNHLDMAVDHLLADGQLSPSVSMNLRAWQRAAEISADRAGLICCRSLDVAANALFKTLSGLSLPGDSVDPEDFAAEWERLADEVIAEGERDQWQLSHPFPTLRMKAMLVFWQAREDLATADREVARLLALMDPSGGSSQGLVDPLLARFFFWGGLYIALADGVLEDAEVARLQTVAPAGIDVQQLVTSSGFDPDQCLEGFVAAKDERRAKLSAVELHRIIEGLIVVAAADGRIDSTEIEHLYELAGRLGIGPAACDILIADHSREGDN